MSDKPPEMEATVRGFTNYVLLKVGEAIEMAKVDLGPLDAIIIITDPQGQIWAGSLLSPVAMRATLMALYKKTEGLATPEIEKQFTEMQAMAEGKDEPRH